MNLTPFQLHPQLQSDCWVIAETAESMILLHRNRLVPWLILVPKTDHSDLFDLEPTFRNTLLDQATLLSRWIKHHFQQPKINFAAIGNIVPQLHLHVVGRNPNDPCWPAPVWGNLKQEAVYTATEVDTITLEVRKTLTDHHSC